MADEAHAKNPQVMEDLYAAFHAADNIVLKKYVTSLMLGIRKTVFEK